MSSCRNSSLRRSSILPMGDGRATRWSLDPRSFLLGCFAPSALVILLLAWIASPWWFVGLLGLRERGTVAHSHLSQLGYAAGSFAEEHSGKLPESLDELATPDARGHTYLKFLPLDPWRRSYVYERREDGSARLSCLGADGRAGSADDVVLVVERGPAWKVRVATGAELRTRER